MNMFVNYVNNTNYIPNNINTPLTNNHIPCNYLYPYKEYDINNNFVGYYWYYGNTIQLVFTISGEVDVNGAYIPANEFVKNKTVQLKLFNFKFDEIYRQNFDGDTKIIFNINQDLADKLLRGIYYLSLDIIDENLTSTSVINNCKINIR